MSDKQAVDVKWASACSIVLRGASDDFLNNSKQLKISLNIVAGAAASWAGVTSTNSMDTCWDIYPSGENKVTAILTLLALYTSLVVLVNPATANVSELYEEIRIHNKKIETRFSNWSDRAQLHADHMNNSQNPKIIKWREQLTELDFHDEISGLKIMNGMINADVTYVDDYHHFHKADYWADPETALTEGGDCEDIALVKAATLHRFDWPSDKVHLLVGFLIERGKKESHAVLMVETSTGDELILRSITDDVVHASDFAFIPIYAVDQSGTLIVKSRNPDHLLSTKRTASD